MFEDLNYIELSGKPYPIKCDLLVLEKLEAAYETLENFERKILNWEYEKDAAGEYVLDKKEQKKTLSKLPNTEALNTGLYLMVNEGIAIENELKHEKTKPLSRDEIVRRVDVSLTELEGIVHGEFIKCFETKNAKTTQTT